MIGYRVLFKYSPDEQVCEVFIPLRLAGDCDGSSYVPEHHVMALCAELKSGGAIDVRAVLCDSRR